MALISNVFNIPFSCLVGIFNSNVFLINPPFYTCIDESCRFQAYVNFGLLKQNL